MGHFTAITRFHPKIMMKHFMINDSCKEIFRHIAPVQHRTDPDYFGSVGIARQLDRTLSVNPSPGSPGYITVYFVGKVLLIDLIKECLEIEVESIVTENSSPRLARCLSDLVVVRSNEISKQGRCFLLPATDKTGQGLQNLSVCLKEHVMQPDSVATLRGPNVDHRMEVVGKGEADGLFHQAEEGLFEVCQGFRIWIADNRAQDLHPSFPESVGCTSNRKEQTNASINFHLIMENLVLWTKSSFNGFANRRGLRRKAQGIRIRISFV